MLGAKSLGLRFYSPAEVDRIWGMCGSYCYIPKAILHPLEGEYSSRAKGLRFEVSTFAGPLS